MSDPLGWSAAKPNAPLSTVSALSAIAIAPAFLLFVDAPALFTSLEFAKLLLVSVAIGLPLLSLCAGLCIGVLHGVAERKRPLPTPATLPGFILEVAKEPRYEWEGLWLGSGLANLLFYGLAARAAFVRFNLPRTLLLFALILAGLVLAAIVLVIVLSFLYRREIPPVVR